MDLSITLPTEDHQIPNYNDELLFIHFKEALLEALDKEKVIHFGIAPDNTADGNNELLTEGTFFRIIAPAYLLDLSEDSSPKKVLKSYKNLIAKEKVRSGTVIVEKGIITAETTIEFIF